MKVWDTECVSSRMQATSLGWQDFMHRMGSERSTRDDLEDKTNINQFAHTHTYTSYVKLFGIQPQFGSKVTQKAKQGT